MIVLDEYEYIRFYNRLWKYDFTDKQLKELYEMFRDRCGLNKKKHHHGQHMSEELAHKLDMMILDGRSQKECCSVCGVSKTTFKRHREKLKNQYGLIPNKSTRTVDYTDYNNKRAESFMKYKDKCNDKRYEYNNEDGIIFID